MFKAQKSHILLYYLKKNCNASVCLSVCLEWMLAVQITPVFASIIEESWLTLVLWPRSSGFLINNLSQSHGGYHGSEKMMLWLTLLTDRLVGIRLLCYLTSFSVNRVDIKEIRLSLFVHIKIMLILLFKMWLSAEFEGFSFYGNDLV